jgi:uncharacterized protein (TIRG00374 family)
MNKLTAKISEWRRPKGLLNQLAGPGENYARKWRLSPYMLPAIILGLAAWLLVPQIAALEKSVSVLGVMSVSLVSLAGLAQVISYLGSGYLLKAIADIGKPRLSIVRGALITMAASSIGLVAGGWAGTALATYRWVRKSEADPEQAALAGVLPTLFNNALLAVVAVVGLAYLWLTGQLSSAEEAGEVLFAAFLGLALAALVVGLCRKTLMERLVITAAGRVTRLLRRPYDPDALRQRISNVYRGLSRLGKRRWIQPVLGAAINIGFDMLTLYLLFDAAGQAADPGMLLAGYGLTFLLGKAAFLFPGGVGVMESGMAAIFTNLGIPGSTSVAVILGYRLVSFWIPALLGFAAIGLLQRTSARRAETA